MYTNYEPVSNSSDGLNPEKPSLRSSWVSHRHSYEPVSNSADGLHPEVASRQNSRTSVSNALDEIDVGESFTPSVIHAVNSRTDVGLDDQTLNDEEGHSLRNDGISPVISRRPNSAAPSVSSFDNEQTTRPKVEEATYHDHISNAPASSWLPYTLRWPWLLFILAVTGILEIAVIVLHAISVRNLGLIDDNQSSGITISSKFVPTLIAVAYVFFFTILLNDVVQTEPFARLSSPSGAPASQSLTWTADAWWKALFNSFPASGRKTSWAMLCSTVALILGFLVISPFSSTLFSFQNVVFTQAPRFSQLDMSSAMPIQANPLSTTYFRTISNVLQNVTTSAWIIDKYAILPFWTGIETAPLGPILSTAAETWNGKTTIFNTELQCERLEYLGVTRSNVTNAVTNDTDRYLSLRVKSESGCLASVTFNMEETSLMEPGFIWSGLKNFTVTVTGDPLAWSLTLENSTCAQSELLMFTTALTDGFDVLSESDIMVSGHMCQSLFYMGESTTTVTLAGQSTSTVEIDEAMYLANRTVIPSSLMNTSSFEDVFLDMNWTTHLNVEVMHPVDMSGSRFYSYGPANLLSSLYNLTAQATNPDPAVLGYAGAMRQRFFGELLRDTFDSSAAETSPQIYGTVTSDRRRLLIVSAVAIVLEVVLGLQLLLLSALFFLTRLKNRPLGLATDPAPVAAVAKLVGTNEGTVVPLRTLHHLAPRELDSILAECRYQIRDGKIYPATSVSYPGGNKLHFAEIKQETVISAEAKSQKHPKLFNFWTLVVLLILLVAIVVAIAVLFWYSVTQGLYEDAFVYSFNVSVKGKDLGDINPASLITTFLAVCVGLWWGSLDTTLRKVQPFLAMAKEPVAGHRGLSVSYSSSYQLWAAFRAVKRKHWVLFLLCTGVFLGEILTIAMSSLWSRAPGALPDVLEVARPLQLRTSPILSTAYLRPSASGPEYDSTTLADALYSLKTSWIYSAVVQLSLNGSEPTWSSGNWSFVPIDQAAIRGTSTTNTGALSNSSYSNVTLQTSAIRARLECSPIDYVQNTSRWLVHRDLTNSTKWNTTASPTFISQGYELATDADDLDGDMLLLRPYLNSSHDVSSLSDYTTLFATNRRLQCCQNITNGEIGSGSIGYWSANSNYAYYPVPAPDTLNFTIKWIHGRPVEGYRLASPEPSGQHLSDDEQIRLLWDEEPRMTALNCMPVIETATANVTIDAANARVKHFEIVDGPHNDSHAFTDDFVAHTQIPGESFGDANITTSHGYLFRESLLNVADVQNLLGLSDAQSSYTVSPEHITDQTFTMRNPGLNVDYMTYSMLSLVQNNHTALLDPGILEKTAQQTFATLFQHFVAHNLSLIEGGKVYQPVSSAGTSKQVDANTATLRVSRPVGMLYMSVPAAWLCMVVLVYLIFTCVVLIVASRQYNKMLIRRIDSIADVAVLVAGSEKLLELIKETPVKELKYNDGENAKLGWFEAQDGQPRWGIELASLDNE